MEVHRLGVTDRYHEAGDMPSELPVFPLRGAILLPRATLTLNVFEPRYLALLDYALGRDHLIGIIQPATESGSAESPRGKNFALRDIGCAGRITAYTESDEGRVVVTLAGIARFRCRRDIPSEDPFRICAVDFESYEEDFVGGLGEDAVDRARLLATLRNYLSANNLNADWNRINNAGNERLVNTLAILSPYGPEEKQALLEATDLHARAEALVALAEMELAARDDGTGSALQ
jgi:uncharacterized protein